MKLEEIPPKTGKILNIFFLISLFFSTHCWSQIDQIKNELKKEPFFEIKQLFFGERNPNVLVANDGSVIASYGKTKFMVRRSEDGGETWGPIIKVSDGIHGGGLTLDENSGDLIAFVEKEHPPSSLKCFRSKDNGKTWNLSEIKILPDKNGIIPSMHMNEHGITLKNEKFKGRLVRPSRFYNAKSSSERKLMYSSAKEKMWKEQYTNAIYSDDGGKTWQTSDPFPANGTGEAAIVELNNGNLYYNSRRHFYNDGINHRMRLIAHSYDGGNTWGNLSVSEDLPDGQENSDYGLMAGLDRLNYHKNDILIFSNIESKSGRKNGMVWVSFDGGDSWPLKKSIDQGKFKYSSLAIGRENTSSQGYIYLLYEFGDFQNEYAGAKIARFNLSWLLHGKEIDQYLK
tara:strand:+ start:2810 stop:4006 length:1197 start_codon:yes stop_codon:yes gene_type:complete